MKKSTNFGKVIDICPNFRYMDTSIKFVWLFTNEHEQVLKKLGRKNTKKNKTGKHIYVQ
jgi:hypothetical protein